MQPILLADAGLFFHVLLAGGAAVMQISQALASALPCFSKHCLLGGREGCRDRWLRDGFELGLVAGLVLKRLL